jgi:hypothetical protein
MPTTMKNFLSIGVMAATLAALALQNASAQAPSGSVSIVVSNSANALYDAMLAPLQRIDLDIPQGSSGDLHVTYDDPFTQDGKGKLAGAGTTQVAVTNEPDVALSFPGTYQTKGTIKGNNGLTTLRLASKASGTAFIENANRKLSVTVSYSITIDSAAGTVSGTEMAKASASGIGSAVNADSFQDVLPPELGDGSWTLVVNFGEPNGTKLTGQATVTLATGQIYPFTVKGTYVASTGQSKLSLKGVENGVGSVLTVTMQGSEITTIKGKVAGQIVSY